MDACARASMGTPHFAGRPRLELLGRGASFEGVTDILSNSPESSASITANGRWRGNHGSMPWCSASSAGPKPSRQGAGSLSWARFGHTEKSGPQPT